MASAEAVTNSLPHALYSCGEARAAVLEMKGVASAVKEPSRQFAATRNVSHPLASPFASRYKTPDDACHKWLKESYFREIYIRFNYVRFARDGWD